MNIHTPLEPQIRLVAERFFGEGDLCDKTRMYCYTQGIKDIRILIHSPEWIKQSYEETGIPGIARFTKVGDLLLTPHGDRGNIHAAYSRIENRAAYIIGTKNAKKPPVTSGNVID